MKGRTSSGISQSRKKRFLDAFAQCGVICQAAEMAGITDRSHRSWMAHSEQYRAAFKEAEERAIQVLEVELRRRAVEGFEDPVFYQGKEVGAVRRYSDLLLIFLLKARRPDVYREVRETKLSGGLVNQTTVTVVHELHEGPAALPPPTSYTPALPPARPSPSEDSEE